jgi:ATP-dependent exoDNAse (exonuclease V) beta subunit
MALLARAAMDGKFAVTARIIERLTDEARRASPFTVYARLLGPGGGRRKFLSRLGPEANDALDEFLNLALDYENRETPSLQGFVSWLRAAEAEVKRDMEQGRDEVRVMTVHGAKGLEAQTVILADTTTRPAGHHPPKLIPLSLGGTEALVWAGNKASDPPAVAEARQTVLSANENEYRRLLYVAMTRARQRLIVCGIGGQEKQDGTVSIPDGCWYRLVEDALINVAPPQSLEIDAEGEVRVMTVHGAKGLEARIVILPDMTTRALAQGGPLLETGDGGFLWAPRKADDCDASAAARALRDTDCEDESLRLLYVALTRARDRLILCGVRTHDRFFTGSWRQVCDEALTDPTIQARLRQVDGPDGIQVTRFGPDPARCTGSTGAPTV